jgi:DNA-directed RNA polymerase specialized sigma subunit
MPRAEAVRLFKAHREGCYDSFEKLSLYCYTVAQKLVGAMERAGVLGSEREDALSTGTLAAIESIDTFDPDRGSFPTWAWINARSAIRKAGEDDILRGVVGAYDSAKELGFDEFEADLAEDYGLTVHDPQVKSYEAEELRGIVLHYLTSFQRVAQIEQDAIEVLKGVYLEQNGI